MTINYLSLLLPPTLCEDVQRHIQTFVTDRYRKRRGEEYYVPQIPTRQLRAFQQLWAHCQPIRPFGVSMYFVNLGRTCSLIYKPTTNKTPISSSFYVNCRATHYKVYRKYKLDIAENRWYQLN